MSNQDYWQQRAERNLQAVEDIAVDYNLELAKVSSLIFVAANCKVP